jgi:hypothetical protein
MELELPPGPHLAPDTLPALIAQDPGVQGVWDLWPGAVRGTLCYTRALCTEAYRDGWSREAVCQLALAHHAKHGWRPLDVGFYKRLLWEALTAVVLDYPDYAGRDVTRVSRDAGEEEAESAAG